MEFSPRQRGWKWIYFPPNQTAGGLGRPGCSVPGRHPDGLGCVHSAAPKAWPQSRASSWGIYRSSGPQLCSPNVTAETSTACDLLPTSQSTLLHTMSLRWQLLNYSVPDNLCLMWQSLLSLLFTFQSSQPKEVSQCLLHSSPLVSYLKFPWFFTSRAWKARETM